jgi:hypothetical protein
VPVVVRQRRLDGLEVQRGIEVDDPVRRVAAVLVGARDLEDADAGVTDGRRPVAVFVVPDDVSHRG